MTKFVAVSKDGGETITKNKEYPILRFESQSDRFGKSFSIIRDDGLEGYCLEFECEHIDCSNWEIKETKNEKVRMERYGPKP